MKILLLEDDINLGPILKDLLEEVGGEVIWELDGSEGVKHIETIDSFDLVVSDYQMPIMSGLKFIGALRKENQDVPIVLFTGSPEMYQNSSLIKREYNVQSVIAKDPGELLDFVKAFKKEDSDEAK